MIDEEDSWGVPSGRVPCSHCHQSWCLGECPSMHGACGALGGDDGFGVVLLVALAIGAWHGLKGWASESGPTDTVARGIRAYAESIVELPRAPAPEHPASNVTARTGHQPEPADMARAGGATQRGAPTRSCRPESTANVDGKLAVP